MKLEVNIEQIVADAVTAALSPDALGPIITANVQNAVKKAIDEQFNYRSPFTKLLEESLQAAMPTTVDGLNRYADLVNKTVVAIVDQHQQQHIAQAVAEKLEKMLKPLPKVMKLSQLIRKLMPSLKDAFGRDDSSHPTIIVERSDDSLTRDYWYLYIDPASNKYKYSCAFRAKFKDEGESECWALEINGEQVGKTLLLGPCYGADRILTQLYLGGVKVILDKEDFDDLYYSEDEDDEYDEGEDD